MLRRTLGTADALAVVLGITVGSGIFRTPGLVAAQLGRPSLIFAAWLLGEAFVAADALEPDPDVQLVRELRADASGRLARRARPERLALEQDRVAAAGLGEVVEGARAHHSAADHDDLGRAWERHQ